MKIKNLVRTNYEVVAAQIKISEISRQLATHSYLVVKDEDQYVGILPSLQHPNLGNLRVVDCLVSFPTVDYESNIENASDLMSENRRDILPVFHDGAFKGILLQSDIIRSMMDYTRNLEGKITSVEDNQGYYTKSLEKELKECQGLLDSYSQYRHTIEKVLKAKSDLLADVSHELRNHLHIILSYVKQGLKQYNPLYQEKIHRFFTRIHANSEKMLYLVDDLLDFSKLESGNSEYVLQMHNLSDLIEIVLEEYSLLLKSKQIAIDYIKPSWSDLALVDGNKISQVIRNLVSNAYKFSRENSVIRIELNHSEEEISLSIIDWGCGISPEELKTLFEKYNRSSMATPGTKGSGLGLPIAYKIVTDHKGRISAKANPEGGAIFTVTLPIKAETFVK